MTDWRKHSCGVPQCRREFEFETDPVSRGRLWKPVYCPYCKTVQQTLAYSTGNTRKLPTPPTDWVRRTCSNTRTVCGGIFDYGTNVNQQPWIPVKCPYCGTTQGTLAYSTGDVKALANKGLPPVDEDPAPTPPPTPPPASDFIKVGSATVKSVADVEKLQEWNSSFRNGDHGLAKIKFPIPPPDTMPTWMKVLFPQTILIKKVYGFELSKAGISDYLNSYLPSRGVTLWRSVYWDGENLCVPFITGLAPLIVIAIVVGILGLAGILSFSISLYKLGKSYVDNVKEQELHRQDRILDVIGEIDDPELQAQTLLRYLKLTEDSSKFPSIVPDWSELFKTPIVIVSVAAAIGLIVFVVMRSRS